MGTFEILPPPFDRRPGNRMDQQQDPNSSSSWDFTSIVIAFNVLQTMGLGLNLLVLATVVFSSKVYRLTTWFMIQLSVIFYCLCMLILALGQVQLGPSPPISICLLQAVMVEAAPVWVCWIVAAHALDMFQVSRGFVGIHTKHKRTYKFWLLAAPGTIAIITLVVALGTAMRFLDSMRRKKFKTMPNTVKFQVARDPSGIICRVSRRTIGHIFSLVFAAVGLFLALIFASLIARLLIRRGWLREIDAGPKYGIITRWTTARLFGLITCLAVMIGLLEFGHQSENKRFTTFGVDEVVGRIALACIPLLVGTGLATQGDILSVWFFWRKEQTEPDVGNSQDENTMSVYGGTSTKFLSLTSPTSV